MSVAVTVLNYNNWQDTLACVESVLASSEPPRWLFVIDNASTNDSLRWFRHWAAGNLEFLLPELGVDRPVAKPVPLTELEGEDVHSSSPTQVVLLRLPHNRGYAAGNNAGLRLALAWGADVFWVLNNDTVVEPQTLGAMRKRLLSTARPGLCGSLIRYMGGNRLVQCRAGGVTNTWTGLSVLDGHGLEYAVAVQEAPEAVEARINFIYGASVMVSRHFLEIVGLMDERFFLYCEEQDWASRAGGRFDFAYAPDACIFHKEGGASGFSGTKVTPLALWRLTRSRLLLTVKHTPWALPTVCLSIGYAALRMVWRRVIGRAFQG